jgi:hypothetical protein
MAPELAGRAVLTRSRRNRYRGAMEVTPEAIVVSVTELAHKVQDVAPIFKVEAKMYVPAQKYSEGIYRVKISIAIADEYSMEHGEFSFDTVKEVKEKQGFKISIASATS